MQLLESLGAGATLMHAAPAEIAGFEELIVRDGQGLGHVFYLSKDGKMVFSGSLLDVRQKKNLTQASYRKFVAAEIAKGIHSRQQDFIPYRQAKHLILCRTHILGWNFYSGLFHGVIFISPTGYI